MGALDLITYVLQCPLPSHIFQFSFNITVCLYLKIYVCVFGKINIFVISKPMKLVGDPKSYRPISLLCVPYKILERLIYTRVEPLIDPLLPKEQDKFRRGKSTVDQVVLLIQNIEDSFEAKKRPVPYLAI